MLISIALDSCKSNNKRAAVKGSPRNFRSKMPNKLLEFFRDNDACYVKKRATDLIDVCTIRFETDDIIFRNMDDGLNFTIKVQYLKELVSKYDTLKKEWEKNKDKAPF